MPNITIVGCGALGSHLAMLLRGEGNLTLIDDDKVEMKNTQSQFFAKAHVRRNKAQALAQQLDFFWGVRPKAIASRLTSDNVHELLKDSDLILDCLDNGLSRRVIQNYVRPIITAAGRKSACLHGGLAANGEFGSVRWDDRFTIDDEPAVGAATCEDGRHLPFVSLVASFLAQAAQAYLRDKTELNFIVYPKGATLV